MAQNSVLHAVILGLSPTGLYVARELGEAGARLLGVDYGPATARSSVHFGRDGTWRIENLQDLLPRLLAHAAGAGQRPFLIATSDVFIEWMIENAAALRTAFAFPACYETAAPDLLDKVRFHALCARHGVETPGIWQAADRGALQALVDEIPFPCILKPVLIHRAKAFLKGHKVLVARSREQYQEFVAAIPVESGAWFVQEIIPGPESSITLFAGYVDSGGALRQGFTARKLRQYPAGFGSASLVISEDNTDTRELCERFLPAIGYRGVCGVEFKRDPRDGRLKIIEINPRPTLWFQLSHAAGKRVVLAAANDLTARAAPPDLPQSNGVLWRYVLKDLVSAAFYTFKGRGFLFPSPDLAAAGATRARCWPVFNAADPKPALMEPLHYVAKAFKRFA
ncbi:MAG TPA: ATP-grasp domain-containing protein [Arenimonas sp.]